MDHFNDLNNNGVRDDNGKVFSEPDFAGRLGALEFDPTSTDPYMFDVDNDGDGVPDSVWVDAGLPVQSSADGRLYKPLVAIMVIDMDGKINLNAHGTIHHTVAAGGSYGDVRGNTNLAYGGYNPANPVVALPIGQGYGPAEVNPAAVGSLFGSPSLGPATLGRLLVGTDVPAERVMGRYGEVVGDMLSARPGMATDGATLPRDFVQELSQWELPIDFWNTSGAALATSYSSPADLNGNGSIAYDLVGQPLYVSNLNIPLLQTNPLFLSAGVGEPLDNVNDPYEIDLSACAAHIGYVRATESVNRPIDSPFTVFELERLLRFNDADARDLPDRILQLAQPLLGESSGASPYNFTPLADGGSAPQIDQQMGRRLVTTCSFDTPTYSLSPLTSTAVTDFTSNTTLNPTGQTPKNLGELLAARLQVENSSVNPLLLRNALVGLPPTGGGPRNLRSFDALLSPELLAGLRMDLNRPFGNGRDDIPTHAGTPGRGIVDEPLESRSEGFEDDPPQWLWNQFPAYSDLTVRADGDNNGIQRDPLDGNDPYAHGIRIRQYYARQLYVLARLVLNKEFEQLVGRFTAISSPHPTAEAARRFAQWAINVVDYRDPDSIMTPFPYDIYPFKDDVNNDGYTWDVDSIYQPRTETGAGIPRTDIVWGMERPELLITETFAIHDRRTKDTAVGNGNTKTTTDPQYPDPHFDQLRRPVGSLFVELFNPTGLSEHTPAEVYENSAVGTSLRLDKRVPGGKIGGSQVDIGDPIWRMAIVDPDKLQNTSTSKFDRDVFQRSPNLDFNKATAQSPQASQIPANFIERTVFFTSSDPGVSVRPHSPERFYRKGAAAIHILPQQYAVIGPADKTVIQANGSQGTGFSISLDEPMVGGPGNASGIQTTLASDPTPGVDVRPAVGVVVNEPRRLSISEPYVGSNSNYDNWDSGHDSSLSADVEAPLGTPDDVPWDLNDSDLKFTGTETGETNSSNPSSDIGYRIVALQRLADPTRPFHATANPYLTVDSMPVDLTAYTGEGTVGTTEVPGFTTEDFRFGSRQRDGTAKVVMAGTNVPNLWKSVADTPRMNDPADDGGATNPVQTLGFLNHPYRVAAGGRMGVSDLAGIANAIPNYLGAPGTAPLTNPVGRPFSSFLWPNRPFVSNTELMDVPWAGPAEVLNEYSLWPRSDTVANDPLPYNPKSAPTYRDAPNRHLLNYFDSDTSNLSSANHELNFHRLLEFVQVPSRFAGTKEMLPPADFVRGNHTLHPPFNFVSRYRDPGRINLNTVLDRSQTLRAIMNGAEQLNTSWGNNANQLWQRVVTSRRGYGTASLNPLAPNPNVPTFFANPFRSYSGGNLVPIDAMRRQAAVPGGAYQHMVDSTLLRPDPSNTDQPLFTFDPSQAYLNGDTNAAVRNLIFQKLGNTVTTRSNVYAVWITVGYFEVDQVNTTNPQVAAAYPDGFRLKQELGVDTGDIERHRAFYIVDRTIPVGFRRGEDMNVEDAILLRRFIE
ncbi:MAG: hypothetical protein R3C10_07620 [Pirellulales bacterium]